MIKRILVIVFTMLTVMGCKSKKKVITKKSKTVTKKHSAKTTNPSKSKDFSEAAKDIVNYAKAFEGVKYKYGGTSKKGMDCSGLVYTSFKQENISLPRTTADLSKTGSWVDIKEVQKGDLLFFATKRNSRKVNHVGIVTNSRIGYV